MMRIVDIIEGTTVDGPGFRTAIYFAGCDHQCPGCHNPSTWPFDAGRDVTVDDLMTIVKENDFDVTLTGGDPLYQAEKILPLVKEVKALGKTVWLYTGFSFEQAMADEKMSSLVKNVDVVVDGPFVEALKNEDLIFRGSSNQRVIDVTATIARGAVVTIDVDSVANVFNEL